MDRFERRAQAIMERGDRIIADRQKKNTMIRRISFSVSGLCAAALIVFGIWKSPALHRVPEIPQLPETVTTEAAETTEPATEQTTAPAEKKTTKPKKTEAATEAATALPTTAAPATETAPALAAPVRTEAPQAVQTQAAVTEAPAAATEAQTAAEIPVSTAEPEQPTEPEQQPTEPAQQPEGGEELATAPPLQCPTQAVEVATLPATALASPVTAPATQLATEAAATWEKGTSTPEYTGRPEPDEYGIIRVNGNIILPTSEEDPIGIKTVCSKMGYMDIAPSYIMPGFELTRLINEEQSGSRQLIFGYRRIRNDNNKTDYLWLVYKMSEEADIPENSGFSALADPGEVQVTEINGRRFRYRYDNDSQMLVAEHLDGRYAMYVQIDGLTQHGAERILMSVS